MRLRRPAELVGDAPYVARVRCADTTIAWMKATFPDDDDEKKDDEGPDLVLPPGVALPFADHPNGPTVETFMMTKYSRQVHVEAARSGWVKTRLLAWPGRLQGWVPREKLQEKTPGAPGGDLLGVAAGGLGSRAKGRAAPNHPRCAAAVAFALRQGGGG